MWLSSKRDVPAGALVNDKSLLSSSSFSSGAYYESGYKDFSHRIFIGPGVETVMRDSVWYMRFIQPINPTTYGTRLFLEGAGGKLAVPRTYITGDVTAVMRYTLLSVDWDATDAGVDYDAQPAPAGDDPYVEVTLTAADGYAVAKRASVLEFSGIGDKLYYGLKAEIISVSGYVFPPVCTDIVIPATVSFGDSGSIWGGCGPPPPIDPCTSYPCPLVAGHGYEDSGCYVSLTLDPVGTCSYTCEDDTEDPPVGHYNYVCTYTVTGSTVTPVGGGDYITVSGCDYGALRLYSHQPPTEIEVVSRSKSADYATLKTATPHGLIGYAASLATSPEYITGVSDSVGVGIASTARASNMVTVTTVEAHGLAVGDYAEIYGSFSTGRYYYVYAPVTGNTFRVSSAGTDYATRAEGGNARRLAYEVKSWTSVRVIDDTTIRYYHPGPNESETPCSGKLVML
jgi:hypothetical protein